ncbi:MAG: DsbA family protein [Pseudomonadota bacterium]|nr:DsbA family protein [Pseudomonadota bacterium]
MKPLPFLIATAAVLATAACNADQAATTANAADIPVTATPVPAPNNGDWSTIVTQTPEGGFLMGNPDAQVKLVEFGSMTCPHCADFDENGLKPLIDEYVKKGLVSFEFRNFVRDPYDITAALVARCGGPTSFFGLTRAMYADQENWITKVQADPAAMQALENQPPQAQFKAIADLAGFPAFAAMRGVPRAKTEACLADPAGASRLVEMNTDAATNFKVPGTPSFLINGKLVENVSNWTTLEPAIKSALNS